MTVALEPFAAAVEDVSRGNPKLPQSEFLGSGALPVVDQGQKYIAGYTNDLALKCRAEAPLVIFGDHTRSIKYVDFPFAIGADGVKVLRVREGWDTKYVYHYLRSTDLPSAGYSRHFKFLKEIQVPRPALDEQRRIAAILDHAEALRSKRRQVITHLDSLTQSIFHDMFGEAKFPEARASEVMPKLRNGVSPATAGTYAAAVLTLSAVTQGTFDPTAVKPGLFSAKPDADKRVTARDFLMCRGNGNKALVGVGAFSRDDRPDLVFPDTVIAGRVDPSKITMSFLDSAWRRPNIRHQIEAASRTTNGTYKVNQQSLSSVRVPLPPLGLQMEFSARVDSIRRQRSIVQRALAADDELFAALQSRAFRGKV